MTKMFLLLLFPLLCQAGNIDCKDKKYPNEKFTLSNVGGSWTTIELEIMCDKSLSDIFELYYRDKEGYFGKWQPFDLTLRTYWTIKKK